MITDNIQKALHNNIDTYDELNNKQYLLCFSSGKNNGYSYVEIEMHNYNYWHLLGCKNICDDENVDVYQACMKKQDIKEHLILTHNAATVFEKEKAFRSTFNFVKNAKWIKIGYVKPSPEAYSLYMALGNMDGVVGYSYKSPHLKNYLIPKSCRSKSLKDLTSNQNKIIFILSKPIGTDKYNLLEYEIKKDTALDIINTEFPALKSKIDIDK